MRLAVAISDRSYVLRAPFFVFSHPTPQAASEAETAFNYGCTFGSGAIYCAINRAATNRVRLAVALPGCSYVLRALFLFLHIPLPRLSAKLQLHSTTVARLVAAQFIAR